MVICRRRHICSAPSPSLLWSARERHARSCSAPWLCRLGPPRGTKFLDLRPGLRKNEGKNEGSEIQHAVRASARRIQVASHSRRARVGEKAPADEREQNELQILDQIFEQTSKQIYNQKSDTDLP